jgi:hypothetical protein
MKILTLFFLFVFFQSAGQIQTVKVRKAVHVSICGLDTGMVSVDTILKYPLLKITPEDFNYQIKGYSATMDDDLHSSWWACKRDSLYPDIIKEISDTDRNKMTLLRVYDIIVVDRNKDTIKVNSVGLLLR